MPLVFWLSIAGLACLCQAFPSSTALTKRWASYCGPQNLEPGEWHRAVVPTFHKFAGTEEIDRVIGCYYRTTGEAEDEVRETCALHTTSSDGCHLGQLLFESETVPQGGSPCFPPEPPPPNGGCYQALGTCANYICSRQGKSECTGSGDAWFGCRWQEPPPRPDVVLPNQPLHLYHPECNSPSLSRTPACVSAMHHYCWYTVKKGTAAIPQEVGNGELGFLCAETNFYDNVKYSEIPGCARGQSQSAECYHEAHLYCDKIGKGGVGIAQEVTAAVVSLGCVPVSTYGSVKMTTLQQYHADCNSPSRGQDDVCAAAVHRYCSSNAFGQAGAITELGSDEVAVACIQGGMYQSVSI